MAALAQRPVMIARSSSSDHHSDTERREIRSAVSQPLHQHHHPAVISGTSSSPFCQSSWYKVLCLTLVFPSNPTFLHQQRTHRRSTSMAPLFRPCPSSTICFFTVVFVLYFVCFVSAGKHNMRSHSCRRLCTCLRSSGLG